MANSFILNMKKVKSLLLKLLLFLPIMTITFCTTPKVRSLEDIFENPPADARPWTYWYWMHGALTKDGITRDLEAMKEANFGGAYIFTIRGVPDEPLIKPSYNQLSDNWWEMMIYAFSEAKRLNLDLGYHVSDGFALAGGPWVTPELSMQKVVWSNEFVQGPAVFQNKLKQPETNEGYYKDIAVYAFPTLTNSQNSTENIKPKVTTSIPNVDASVLTNHNNTTTVGSNKPCWIQYEFDKPFTARSMSVSSQWADYQSRRLILQVSDDGKNFRQIMQLDPPRMGWQDYEQHSTFAIGEITSKYFRFVFNPKGSEPGSEDLDPAKWSPRLRVKTIELFSKPVINQYEGKSGLVWRIAPQTTDEQTPQSLYTKHSDIVDITEFLQDDGTLNWEVPEGEWTILRMGHTSTGHTNATGGGAIGLEVDKFNPDAVKVQFNGWFNKALEKAGTDLADIVKTFHVDSWECGNQNWSSVFENEFENRRGYNPKKYLPIISGLPVENSEFSERFLYDIRSTIAELVVENFYGTLKNECDKRNLNFSAEALSPVFISDNMEHYKYANLPMGEFWLNSPSHDKPNDIIDAISGARMYGHNIVQAEAFTQVRIEWDEHPRMLKTLGDKFFAFGVNRFVFHVFMQNPWMENRRPGMTLDGIGLFLQPDQTWWKPGFAWFDYITKSQALLQAGNPVVDIAIFTGEEIPRRAFLPDQAVKILPGIAGEKMMRLENIRLQNKSFETREMPVGVRTSENMAVWKDWSDPLKGYAYDSFNKDALLNLTSVKNGKIYLQNGLEYSVLVIPSSRAMMPNGKKMSVEVAEKLLQLAKDGATIIFEDVPTKSLGLKDLTANDEKIIKIFDEIFSEKNSAYYRVGKGKVFFGTKSFTDFNEIGIEKDLIIKNINLEDANGVAWNHRTYNNNDIYFISNQIEEEKNLKLSFRISDKTPYIFNAVNGQISEIHNWKKDDKRISFNLLLDKNESLFIVFTNEKINNVVKNKSRNNKIIFNNFYPINERWKIKFDETFGGPNEEVETDELFNWINHKDEGISNYSGTAKYSTTFNFDLTDKKSNYWLTLGQFEAIAKVFLNGNEVGVIWTYPLRLDVTNYLKEGENILEIEVTNTWRNRLLFDRNRDDKIADYHGRWYIKDKSKMDSGLIGPVTIISSKQE